MTRIISGEAGGRRLRTPTGDGTRPTTDRVREALFSALESRDVLDGAHVMDLYAGSGALGLEAASRGAASVLLVESDRGASATIRANISDLGVAGARLQSCSVEQALNRPASLRYDLVLADPPYDVTEESLAAVLEMLLAHQWLAQEPVIVIERSSRSPEPTWPDGIVAEGSKSYGETVLWFATQVGPDYQI
ncbi:16S rRNA (guanine(966)-N(2))-methyltransferase RsmD [Janibacter sp. Soil728]|uniref:16S rRNA (guanine(966)-N(2))-methyltransferase RsmD n=1 Tax=Janibacter sp. Soil728 TaxID=1736393 RepID=UPI0006F997F7|nr:16S rRNA (guanine(966)-N(2))-methyltransferase RsmD [Janibacter sp. Soil728]KRE38521.1 16S rRNA (guanine(966)-N(2))-methyltransferase RsmD [Janibacter sp. Soil728]